MGERGRQVDIGRCETCGHCGVYIGPPDSGFVGCECTSAEPAAGHYEAKRDQGKLSPSLIPWRGLQAVIEVAGFGIRKGYLPHSWKEVPDAQARYREALLRHALEYAEDAESCDPESTFPHLAHVAWNSLALLALRWTKS